MGTLKFGDERAKRALLLAQATRGHAGRGGRIAMMPRRF
jgi:hypothetical protein